MVSCPGYLPGLTLLLASWLSWQDLAKFLIHLGNYGSHGKIFTKILSRCIIMIHLGKILVRILILVRDSEFERTCIGLCAVVFCLRCTCLLSRSQTITSVLFNGFVIFCRKYFFLHNSHFVYASKIALDF